MKIVFDQGTPAPLRGFLPSHQVSTLAEMGWSQLSNGELLSQAESDGFDCLITTDQSLKHQQNLSGRGIRIVVLLSTSWPRIKEDVESISGIVNTLAPGGYAEVAFPYGR